MKPILETIQYFIENESFKSSRFYVKPEDFTLVMQYLNDNPLTRRDIEVTNEEETMKVFIIKNTTNG